MNPLDRLLASTVHLFDLLDRLLASSPTCAWTVIAGLPLLGATAFVCGVLPLFASLMAVGFLLAMTLVGYRALRTFVGPALRLVVTARLTLVVVLAVLLLCAASSVWTAVASATLLWLAADRLLGRRALYDLWKLLGQPPEPAPQV